MKASEVEGGFVTVDGRQIGRIALCLMDYGDEHDEAVHDFSTPRRGAIPASFETGRASSDAGFGATHPHLREHLHGGEVPRHMGSAPRPRHGGERGTEDRPSEGGTAPSVSSRDVPMSGTLQEQRNRIADELRDNPALQHRFRQVLYNEEGMNETGVTSIAESAMNRALVRGTSLETELQWHDPRSGHGYYARGGGVGWQGSQAQREYLDRAINRALEGSDISRGATDNSSAGLAARERATGSFIPTVPTERGRDTYFRPGTAEPALATRWQRWRSAVESADAAKKAAKPVASTTDPNTNPM